MNDSKSNQCEYKCADTKLIIFVGVFITFVFASSCYVLYQAVTVFPLRKVAEVAYKTEGEAATDSLQIADLKTIENRLRNLELQNARLIDDVRQETNNNINILNGWISFWMGILAFIGVFVPLVLQFRLKREDKRKFSELQQKVLDQLAQSDKAISDKLKEFDKQMSDHMKMVEATHLKSLVNSITMGVNYHLLMERSETSDELKRLYENSLNHFDSLVTRVINRLEDEKRNLEEEEVVILMTALLSMYDLYINLYQPGLIDNRDGAKIASEISTAINHIHNFRDYDLFQLIKELNNLKKKMYRLKISGSRD